MDFSTVLHIGILIFSVILHEVAHGVAASALGDPTAKLQGRLTLNPLPHIDPFGSVILPLLLWVSGSPFLFGWAKPVPYNPYNLTKGGRFAESLVALAGPLTNILLAIFFALLVRFGIVEGAAATVAVGAVLLNVLLALFNALPIPPLDGSKIIEACMPGWMRLRWRQWTRTVESWGMVSFGLILLFIFFFSHTLFAVVSQITAFLIGVR